MSEHEHPDPETPPADSPATATSAVDSTAATGPDQPRRMYVRAVGPKLRKLLYGVFVLVALLFANSAYLGSITFLGWLKNAVYENNFFFWMFLAHIVLGLLLILPLVLFGVIHFFNARKRQNRRAVRVGYALFVVSILVLVTGLMLVRVSGLFDLKHQVTRKTVYWLHVVCPLAAGWLYWLHRLAGPRIKWHIGLKFGGVVGTAVVLMVLMHSQDPRKWNEEGSAEGVKYFEPSLARTATGNFIPQHALMMDHYCKKCHPDVHAGWRDSVHKFSSFNNPAYLPSVNETREVSFKNDGNVRASRWCAGCHDPVPFFSGAFDNKDFDDVNDPTAHAGITCTVCHAITNVNSNRGNSDYTIEEPLHYPFAYSKSPVLQWINNQMVKAKPGFHTKTFLKPFHKTAEFCSVCHKVHLPLALNKFKKINGQSYHKEFIRGQNHYDAHLLSGVSGTGVTSFYYPPKSQKNCNGCHMPLVTSLDDFGARLFDDSGKRTIHNHLFPSANTMVAWFRGRDDVIRAHQQFLEGVMRVDIFGVKEDGRLDGRLHAPLRPRVPQLEAGRTYLLETVIRTVKLGHVFTQGTVDSNEVWLEVTVTSGGKVIGKNGGLDADREVDPWSHFVNVFLLDNNGHRISRRNPQDIFTPLYNHQIPPGAGQTVHYLLELPDKLDGPITIELKLNYRKFDKQYTDFIAKSVRPGDRPIRGYDPKTKTLRNLLPITLLAVDRVTFPVVGSGQQAENPDSPIPTWQRWNDYGIGLLLKGKSELRQAAAAFAEVEKLGRYDGPLNLARVLFREGDQDQAAKAVQRALQHTDPAAPPWTVAWLSGVINQGQNRLEDAERNFRKVLEDHTPEMQERGFDFSRDYRVINLLGRVYFQQALQLRTPDVQDRKGALLQKAVATFRKTLAIDSENSTAHFNLQQLYTELGDEKQAAEHERLHARYKVDDNARDRAIGLAKARYKAANAASEEPVFYKLNRLAAPGLKEPGAVQPTGNTGGGGE